MKLSHLLQNRTGEVYRIKSTDSIANAASIMTRHRIGALFVEDNQGKIVGVISERDIVIAIPDHQANLQNITVSQLMTTELVRCTPDNTVNEAMGMMTDRRVRHLPVFDGDQLIGLVSIGDLVKYRIMEVQSEVDSMRAYIAS
jgi:CBS domain-containing protein